MFALSASPQSIDLGCPFLSHCMPFPSLPAKAKSAGASCLSPRLNPNVLPLMENIARPNRRPSALTTEAPCVWMTNVGRCLIIISAVRRWDPKRGVVGPWTPFPSSPGPSPSERHVW